MQPQPEILAVHDDDSLPSPRGLSPSGSSKDTSVKAITPARAKQRLGAGVKSGERKPDAKITPVASVRAAEAEEQQAPGKAKQQPLPVGDSLNDARLINASCRQQDNAMLVSSSISFVPVAGLQCCGAENALVICSTWAASPSGQD